MIRTALPLVLLTALLGCQPSLTPQQQAAEGRWQSWLEEQNRSARDPKTSFLNIRDAMYLAPGQSAYLDSQASPERIRWHDEASEGDLGLTHQGAVAALKLGEHQATLAVGEEWPLTEGLFLTVGRLHNEGLRAFVRDPNHPRVRDFPGYRYYPYNPEAAVTARFEPGEPKTVTFQTIRGLKNQLVRVGQVHFPWQGESVSLSAYHPTGEAPLEALVFLFKDGTNGDETYGGGRELLVDLPSGPAEPFTLDFNYTVNLYCAHSTFWNCPVLWDPPLAIEVAAGEQLPRDH
ncbi:DUF1684 domain-containing protein [Ferrimonas balearica]|uniref:DUF1684 domain-containing protein n=1 Tax=Ferrimonas balearica TaxID=44012 RepID=UPI001C99D873|nr:DUF1684 domain-containing protein [Ferrimonas balearica]MBY5992176.1 DUF1684 domain-containing protein [Ferrimonas balearica]